MTQISADKAAIELRRRGNQWAYRQLRVTDKASARDMRAAFLKQVEQADFFPDESLLPAFRWLQPDATEKTPSLASSDFPHQNDTAVREEIQQFANRMFTMTVPTRTQQWNDLALAAYHCPRAKARLKVLVPGLRIDLAELGQMDAVSRELANHLLGLFPLDQISKATRRQQVMTMLASQRPAKEWKTLSGRFRKDYPAFAALDNTLLVRLSDRAAEVAKIAKLEHKRAIHRPVTTRQNRAGTQSYWWVVGVVLFFALFIGRFAAQSNRTSSPGRKRYDVLNRQQINQLMEQLRRDIDKLPQPPSEPLDPTGDDMPQSSEELPRFRPNLPKVPETPIAPGSNLVPPSEPLGSSPPSPPFP